MNSSQEPAAARSSNCSTLSAPGRLRKNVITALASSTTDFGGASEDMSEFAVALALFVENVERATLQRTAQAANKAGRERLQNEPVSFLKERYLCSHLDFVFAAQLGGDDELAFCGDGSYFGFHGLPLKVVCHSTVSKTNRFCLTSDRV